MSHSRSLNLNLQALTDFSRSRRLSMTLGLLAMAASPLMAFGQPSWTHTEPVDPALVATPSVLLPLSDQRLLLTPQQGITAVLGDDLALRQTVRLNATHSGTPPVATPDGGLLQIVPHQLISDRFELVCRVQRFDAQLLMRWFEHLPRDTSDQTECPLLDIDGGGRVWAGDDRLYALSDRDGIRRFETTAAVSDLKRVKAIAADPGNAGGVYALASMATPGDTVLALAGDGKVRWRWTETSTSTRYDSIRRSARGDLILTGLFTEAAPARTVVTLLDASGQVRWRYVTPSEASRLALSSDGRVLYSTVPAPGSSESPELVMLSAADGREEWRRVRRVTPAALHLDSTGGVLVVENEDGPTVLERLDASGVTRWRVTTSTRYQESPHRDAFLLRTDGSVLALTVDGVIHRFAAADGKQSERTASDTRLGYGYSAMARLGADGHFAFTTIEQRRSGLTVLAPDGRVQWRVSDPSGQFDSLTLDAPERLCAIRAGVGAKLGCWQLSDGTPLWERGFDLGDSSMIGLGIAALPDRRVVAVAGISGQFNVLSTMSKRENPVQRRLLVVDSQGRVLADQPLAAVSTWQQLGRDGEYLYAHSAEGQTTIERYDSRGKLRFATTPQSLNLGNSVLVDGWPLSQGESLLLVQRSTSESMQDLVLLDASGNVRWQQARSQRVGRLKVAEQGDALFVTTHRSNALAPLTPSDITRLRRTDGVPVWRIQAPQYNQLGIRPRLMLDRSGQQLAFQTTLRDSHEVQVFATTDGQLLEQRTLVSAPGQLALGTRLDPSGDLRTIAYEDSTDRDTRIRVDRHAPLFQGPVAPDVGRVARSGAWFDATRAGQGWLLDVLPASRTMFAAWFTYEATEAAPQSTPARLRWYTLQGTYADGADHVELDILENRGGAFAAPPVTTARKVGSATLRFNGCTSGLLDYRFDPQENGGRADRVALRALAIRDIACPQQPSERQASGFSSAASGAWFDPASAGQGVVGVVQPPNATQAGLMFAGWFHYDPPGGTDDARGQAWLTLQGELPATANGSAEVGIFRTLGGSLGDQGTRNTVRIGSATVSFEGCDRMRLVYRFDSSESAVPYSGVTGIQQMVKLGGCTRS